LSRSCFLIKINDICCPGQFVIWSCLWLVGWGRSARPYAEALRSLTRGLTRRFFCDPGSPTPYLKAGPYALSPTTHIVALLRPYFGTWVCIKPDRGAPDSTSKGRCLMRTSLKCLIGVAWNWVWQKNSFCTIPYAVQLWALRAAGGHRHSGLTRPYFSRVLPYAGPYAGFFSIPKAKALRGIFLDWFCSIRYSRILYQIVL